MKKLLLMLGIVAALMTGCKSVASAVEGEWEIRYFEINGVAQEICAATLNVERNGLNRFAINGNSGVNSYFGTAKIKGNSFTVNDNLASTKMAGEPKAMEFEDNFMKAFADSKKIEFKEENGTVLMTLKNGEGSSKITFIRK